jgi:phosphopantothenoylcysteine decarboxylase/phosphopantothenate--cysteine ligase
MLTDKSIILGVTGGIAAYKAADLASKLTQEDAQVRVVMTDAATKLVAPLTFHALTHTRVIIDMFTAPLEYDETHISLSEKADAVVIAPATANTIAKIDAGMADNMLTGIVLATKAPVIIAPAMNVNMWENEVTQENIKKLKARGFIIVEPGYGRLASGRIGYGRLADIDVILGTIKQVLGRKGDLAKRRIIITAGGTREPLDPVRHIGNRSSGKMGYAVAEAARDRGAKVTLISASTSLPDPAGIEVIHVQTAGQMKDAVSKAVSKADALIMAAAVADYQPKSTSNSKIKKEAETLTLELVRTPDIITEVQGDLIRVGFAAESEDVVANARQKLEKKNLDLIVANDITSTDSGFGTDTNKVTIIDKKGNAEELPLLTKREVGERILDKVAKLFRG